MALAAIIKAAITKHAESLPDLPKAIRSMLWCCWPEEAVWMRNHGANEDLCERVDRLSNVPVLVLDDLGRERIKGSYTDDWSVSQLDLIINRRNRMMQPIFWTSNVPLSELIGLYGASFVGRLCEDNPLIWVDGLSNMRAV